MRATVHALSLLRARRASSLVAASAAAASPPALAAAAAPPAPPPLAGARVRALAPAPRYVVSTPIGALRDITLRALDVLAAADAILCEDSRATRRLLTAHGLVARNFGGGEFEEVPWATDADADVGGGGGGDGDGEVEGAGEGAGEGASAAASAAVAALAAAASPRILIGGARADAALARLRQGQSLALVSDAGTPSLSDPGARIVAAARAAGFAVRSVPGASAPLAALACSGWDVHSHYAAGRSGFAERAAAARQRRRAASAGFGPVESAAAERFSAAEGAGANSNEATASPGFVFLGFLPPPGAARRQLVAQVAREPGTSSRTVVLFEAGRRLRRTLLELGEACEGGGGGGGSGNSGEGDGSVGGVRAVLVCRELTKLHEEQRAFASLRSAAAAYWDGAESRGEFTILVGPRRQ